MKQNMCFRSTFEPMLLKFLAYFTSILSVYVVISELLIMFQIDQPMIPQSSQNTPLITILLGYLTLTTYYGLFNIRISSVYALDPTGITDSFSLLYSARLLTGLAPPLCFNFLKLVNLSTVT